MSQLSDDVLFQFSNVAQALLRNVTHRFKSVSFSYLADNSIIVRIILSEITSLELDHIDDFETELTSMQIYDRLHDVETALEGEKAPLPYQVYAVDFEEG